MTSLTSPMPPVASADATKARTSTPITLASSRYMSVPVTTGGGEVRIVCEDKSVPRAATPSPTAFLVPVADGYAFARPPPSTGGRKRSKMPTGPRAKRERSQQSQEEKRASNDEKRASSDAATTEA
eukprot:CAMPEP_0174724354 /NCGR_PEP_ID=MMETSP1094-20130205/43146_1 /TAXON_ID=156173 /ORGANISM="Chrysochromulina brevifilum, Strain UTEX LB 985" /LENGTH=125 /DNA_ID=CAMNT_0015925557 /DNA_START=114 /DNA_END=491 /DNA_ORIENTATION=+